MLENSNASCSLLLSRQYHSIVLIRICVQEALTMGFFFRFVQIELYQKYNLFCKNFKLMDFLLILMKNISNLQKRNENKMQGSKQIRAITMTIHVDVKYCIMFICINFYRKLSFISFSYLFIESCKSWSVL